MNKYLDLMIATQLTTVFAFFAAIGAHLMAEYANPNWQFAVYVLLGISMLFMLAPYVLFLNQEIRNAH